MKFFFSLSDFRMFSLEKHYKQELEIKLILQLKTRFSSAQSDRIRPVESKRPRFRLNC